MAPKPNWLAQHQLRAQPLERTALHCLTCGCLLSAAAQQATLLELLDAPQLMDTCVRNGIYDEALDLHAFIMRVALLHPDLPVVKLLAAQVGLMSTASAVAAL
jgi:hypothetical protein